MHKRREYFLSYDPIHMLKMIETKRKKWKIELELGDRKGFIPPTQLLTICTQLRTVPTLVFTVS